MKYDIDTARIMCPCVDYKDHRSWHLLSTIRYCNNCEIRRCLICTLHSPTNKRCLRCKREYDIKETHCFRCYICPICDTDLESYPLLYKNGKRENEINQFELVKHPNDKCKIVGKAVHFKCKNLKCKFRFTTKIETRPQTLQQIVTSNIRDEIDLNFEILKTYADWCLNYNRALDKKLAIKWKTEILKRFPSFELAKILQSENKMQDLIEKEEEVIRTLNESEKLPLFPIAKQLYKKMNDICPTCLEITKPISEKLLLAYAVPMIGYPSSKVTQMNGSLSVPVLVSFINLTKKEMNMNIMGVEFNIGYEYGSDMSIDNVPTCLVSHCLDSRKQEESPQKDIEKLNRLIWSNDNENNNVFEDTVDIGDNWITRLFIVDIESDENTRKGKIIFKLNVTVKYEMKEVDTIYEFCAIII
jgi:hypothetical protein